MVQGDPKNVNKRRLATNGVVDDPFREFERQELKWEQRSCYGQQNELVTLGMLPNEAKDRRFDRTGPPCQLST